MENIIKYFRYYLYHFRWLNFSVLLVVSIFTSSGLKFALNTNNEVNIWFRPEDPVLQAYYTFNEEFGNDRIIVLNYHSRFTLFNEEVLKKIKGTSEKIEAVNGVKKVWSFINMKDLYRVDSAGVNLIRFQSYFNEEIPQDTLQLKNLERKILQSPLLKNRLINSNGNSCVLLIHLESFERADEVRGDIIDEIKNISYDELGEENVNIGGLDVVTYGLNVLSKHDFSLFIILNYLLMLLIIIFFYNRLIYIIIAFLTTFVSIATTLSIYGITGFCLNIFTIIIPSLLIMLGLILVLYIINEYEVLKNQYPNTKNNRVVFLALGRVFKPCFFASLTTIIGFISLVTSPTSVIKEFGVFSALGILITFFSGFTFSAIFLSTIRKSRFNTTRGATYTRFLIRLNKSVFRHRSVYTFVMVTIIVGAIVLSRKIKTDMYPLGYFPANHKVYKDHEKIVKNWGNYMTIDLVLEVDTTSTIFSWRTIKAVQAFIAEIKKHENVEDVYCYLDVMNRFAEVMYHKSIEEVLKSPFLSRQYVQFLKRNYVQESSIKYVSDNMQKARITLIGPNLSANELKKGITVITGVATQHFNGHGNIRAVGYPALFIKIMDYAYISMRNSVVWAFIFIFITMSLWMKNLKMAIIAMIPNLFPILTYLGLLGLFKINLDLATATIAAIIMGITIDDTIHFMSKYIALKKKRLPVEDAIRETYLMVGRIILISSIILVAGFTIFIFASLKTVVYFGILNAISVLFILIGDLILLPIILNFINKPRP